MSGSPHLLLAVTAHGYGHLAQSAPVVEALTWRIPRLRVTLQGDIDPAFARRRLPPGFVHRREVADLGLLMDGPLAIRWEDSLAAYESFELDYERRLARQTDLLRELAPDLVLADVPWLPLEAARRLGIPGVGLCSFTWYDILLESPLAGRLSAALLGRMRQVYAAADLFVRPVPAMPIDWLPEAREVGPIAFRCPDRRAELRQRLGVPPDRPLALMQFGGFAGLEPLRGWPEQEQVHWLVGGLDGCARGDTSALDEHGLNVLDVLGSVDLMLVKPGYGSYAEAACHGVPVLYVPRPDWPEAAPLTRWMEGRVPIRAIALADLMAGRVAEPIAELLAEGPAAPVEPSGAEEAADLLLPWLQPSERRGSGGVRGRGGPVSKA